MVPGYSNDQLLKAYDRTAQKGSLHGVQRRIATHVESDESSEEDVIEYDMDHLPSEASNPDSVQVCPDEALQKEVRNLQSEVSRLHKSECCNQTTFL